MTEQSAQSEKHITSNYAILDNQGTVLESSDEPLTYQQGQETSLFPQIINALTRAQSGDEFSVELEPEEAFGHHNPDLTFTDDIQNSPPHARQIGAEIEAKNDAGEVHSFRVVRIEEGKITVDANHPYAGKALTYRVNVKQVH